MSASCTSCGFSELEPGWIGDGATMVALWVAGPLERHLLGAPKLSGQEQVVVQSFRCAACGHLELFAPRTSGEAP